MGNTTASQFATANPSASSKRLLPLACGNSVFMESLDTTILSERAISRPLEPDDGITTNYRRVRYCSCRVFTSEATGVGILFPSYPISYESA